MTELTQTECQHYMRPNFFVNTPDINPYYLQTSGRPGFQVRLMLAASLAGNYGVYNGFELCEGTIIGEAYRQWRIGGKGGNRISFSSIDCSGRLVVTDTDQFESALMSGIGPAKAFGCGLLLIRPA